MQSLRDTQLGMLAHSAFGGGYCYYICYYICYIYMLLYMLFDYIYLYMLFDYIYLYMLMYIYLLMIEGGEISINFVNVITFL
jgi:hypothetical protein